MTLKEELISELKSQGAGFVHFVDISSLPEKKNKGFPIAILFGIILSKEYLQEVSDTPGYVKKMLREKTMESDEFHLTELRTDALADQFANFLKRKGYAAYSQSEKNIEKTGFYNKEENRTPLPHKTIALMAGMGWIGKNNLLVTPEYGCGISMCTVLTDAPIDASIENSETSRCGSCRLCVDTCPENALKGKLWDTQTTRDEIVDVSVCTTCLECMVACPYTTAYYKK